MCINYFIMCYTGNNKNNNKIINTHITNIL